jgi:protein TonB
MFDQLIESGGMHVSARKPLTLTLALFIHGMVIGSLILVPLILPPSLTDQIARYLATIGTNLPPLISPSGLKVQPRQEVTNLIAKSSLLNSIQVAEPVLRLHSVPLLPPEPTEDLAIGIASEYTQTSGNNLVWLYRSAPENRAIVPHPDVKPQDTTKPEQQLRIKRGGDVQAAYLIRRIQPVYPPPARIAHIQGKVELAAVISLQGTIEDLRVISGHPLLIQAAMDAVKNWRYRPTILNGVPCQVETTITVNFTLNIV